MAEKKERKIVAADGGEVTGRTVKEAKPVGNSGPLRLGAVILWVLAIVFEVLALLVYTGKINLTFMPQLWQIIAFLVLDLICVIIGSQLWKKANRIKPASKANALKFWLWNNMGVIVCAFAFIPFIILALSDKNADKKTKAIATVVAIIALLIGGLASYDWNPISAEEQASAVSVLGDGDVYWSPFGHKYHTSEDCQALNQSETLTVGTVEQAIAAGREDLCKFCAKRDNITGVRTEDGVLTEEDVAADDAA
ncbi:MAG: hypothetical protein IKN53_01660 [Oscillibacter sp.]|nr:hypothetical protein [Oscillibacter sp.]